MLSRDEILGANDLKTETVDVPEWDGKVIVRELTAEQLDAYQQAFVKGNGRTPNARALLVAKCLIDENGNRLFEDKDVKLLGEKSGVVIDRLWDTCARLSKMTSATEEEAEEDFGEAQAEGSASA